MPTPMRHPPSAIRHPPPLIRGVVAAAACLIPLGAGWNALALTLVDASVAEVVDQSELVVEGRVVAHHFEETDKVPLLFVHIAIDRVLKGATEATEIEVGIVGGPFRDLVVHIPGAPYLMPDEHVLLPLTRIDDGRYGYASWGSGLLREHNGLTYAGGDHFALDELLCTDKERPSEVEAHAAREDDLDQAPVGSAVAMPWAEAVAALEQCIGGAQ